MSAARLAGNVSVRANAPTDEPCDGGDTHADAPLDAMPIDKVWREYRRTGSERIRNHLIEHYLPLVRANAERYIQKLPKQVDVEDLVSYGYYGLIEAINKFDPDRNTKFETFSSMHIRGAIIDELRVQDWVPRGSRARQAKVEGVRQRIFAEHGRYASDEEIAAHLHLEGDEAERVLGDSSPTRIVSISRDRYRSDGESDTREVDVIKDRKQQDPRRIAQRNDLRELVTRRLSRAERLIVILYYYESMTMKEIGATLDLSESRVSQMHSLILKRLKSQVRDREREFERDD